MNGLPPPLFKLRLGKRGSRFHTSTLTDANGDTIPTIRVEQVLEDGDEYFTIKIPGYLVEIEES